MNKDTSKDYMHRFFSGINGKATISKGLCCDRTSIRLDYPGGLEGGAESLEVVFEPDAAEALAIHILEVTQSVRKTRLKEAKESFARAKAKLDSLEQEEKKRRDETVELVEKVRKRVQELEAVT